MKQILGNAELERIHFGDVGLVYNDFTKGGSRDNVLHAAGCRSVMKSNTNVDKYFFSDLREAAQWLNANRGREGTAWRRCGNCHADGRSVATVTPSGAAPAPTPPSKQNSAVFTEAEVEALLMRHLGEAGYEVRPRVRVPNGIIDLVAQREGERWVIEVKGEDRGGYTSAEMNLQVGVGQIASRMTDADTIYALGIPATPNFMKVLRKYRGSVGFERLGICFFIVRREGDVDAYDAKSLMALIAGL